MSNLAVRPDTPLALQMDETELLGVLRNSLYPGASDASIKMVVNYCRATGLDPMMKPVHLVPIYSKQAKGMVETVMPGIGKYRTDASRTGQLVGITRPEFGPMLEAYGIVFPEWCRVTVKRLVNGMVCDFEAEEYWMENYATAGRDTDHPNTMWRKRPRGQLAKCAEAQALRKGFTEVVGSGPTAEEMEGRYVEVDAATGEVTPRGKPTVSMPQAKATVHTDKPDAQDVDVKDKSPNASLASPGEIAYIKAKLTKKDISISEARNACGLAAGDSLEGLTKDEFIVLKDGYK